MLLGSPRRAEKEIEHGFEPRTNKVSIDHQDLPTGASVVATLSRMRQQGFEQFIYILSLLTSSYFYQQYQHLAGFRDEGSANLEPS